MKIHFLGTNGWYDTKTGETNCVLIDAKEAYIILDAGNGLHKIDQYIKESKPIYLFIGHLHLDHINGLHVLNKFRFKTTLNIYSREGAKKDLGIFINHPFTVPYDKLPYKVKINELGEGEHALPFQVTTKKLFHSDTCFGYRFTLEKKVVTYCVDTGICPNDRKLAQNADLLIHECSFKKNDPPSPWGHTAPDQAAKLAREAGVGKLVLTHFAADLYLSLEERNEAAKIAQKIFPNTFFAKDNMVFDF